MGCSVVGLGDGTAICGMEGGAILVANMLRSPRDLADHVANQFTASSGCIHLNGSFCFGCLRGQASFFVSLPPLRNCSLTGGAGKQGMILLLAGYANVAQPNWPWPYWHAKKPHIFCRRRRQSMFLCYMFIRNPQNANALMLALSKFFLCSENQAKDKNLTFLPRQAPPYLISSGGCNI